MRFWKDEMETTTSQRRSGRNRLLASLALLAVGGLLIPNYRTNINANTSRQTTREVQVRMLRVVKPNNKERVAKEVSLAIMGAHDFDVTTVDASSIVFAGAGVSIDAMG